MTFTILEKVHTAIAKGIDDENILLGFIDQSDSDSRHSTHTELDEIQFQYVASHESFWTLYRETASDNFAAVDLLLRQQCQYYSKYLYGPFYTFILEKACLQGSNKTLRFFLENGYGFSDKPLTVASAAILSPTQETVAILFHYNIHLSQAQLNDLLASAIDLCPSCDYALFIKNGAQVEDWHYEELIWKKNPEGVAFLLDRGYSENARFGNAFTPLEVAVSNNDLKTVRLLLRNEADPNLRARDGQAPLHTSIIHSNYEIASLLLTKGASLDWKHGDDESPLMTAVRVGELQITRLILLRSKIPPNMMDMILRLAVRGKHWKIRKELQLYAQKQKRACFTDK